MNMLRSGAAKPWSCRVVSYNVLSQYLCDEESLPKCDPKHIDEDYRKDLLEQTLDAECKRGSIICLQEVCDDWAGWLTTFFEKRNYQYINSQWSGHHSGYMGTSIAFSRDHFEMEQVEFPHPFRRSWSNKPSTSRWLWKKLLGVSSNMIIPALLVAPVLLFGTNWFQSPQDKQRKLLPFYGVCAAMLASEAAYRVKFPDKGNFHDPNIRRGITARHSDVLPMVKLVPKGEGGRPFWLTCVHMPCKFWNEKLMVAFAWFIANTAHGMANGIPYLIVGDFNAKPPREDTYPVAGVYELYSKGKLEPGHPFYPTMPKDNAWKPELPHPLRSAYALKNGFEPDATNYLFKDCDTEVFADCLDYIWLSPEWDVLNVDKVLTLDELKAKCESFPCEDNPSDHQLIAAELIFNSDESYVSVDKS